MVKLSNLLFVSTVRLDASNALVASNLSAGADDITIEWVDQEKRTAKLLIAAAGLYITIDAEDKVVGAVDPQVFQLQEQSNGSNRIKAEGDTDKMLVINDEVGPVTNESVHVNDLYVNKQFWEFAS